MKLFSVRENSSGSFDFEGNHLIDEIKFKKRKTDGLCACFKSEGNILTISTSYYIGTDWIPGFEKSHSVYVESKINTKYEQITDQEKTVSDEKKNIVEVDVLKMLFEALREPEVRDHTQELFEIKFDSEWIPLNRKQDLISPLIMIQFLNMVKDIVRKGLKKSYYQVEENLHAKVKGKVLVAQTIKRNLVKNQNLNTVCQYEQFGVNGLENRILKKTLAYVKRYLSTCTSLAHAGFFQESLNFIQPAFLDVSEEVSLNDIKHLKFNPFYKSYAKAIELAKLILQRFSYNLNSIQDRETILTPPFWIDMSKLFELYVLRLLKDSPKHGSKILYHPTTYGNELDYLLVDGDKSIVIDAKYKLGYKFTSHEGYHEDIRQVSGYARLKNVRQKAGVSSQDKLLDCLIIYPDQEALESIPENLKQVEIKAYERVYKVGVKLPIF